MLTIRPIVHDERFNQNANGYRITRYKQAQKTM